VSVSETEYKIAPAKGSAKAGKVTITIKNAGAIQHALSIENAGPGGKDLKSSTVDPGGTTTLSATIKPGKYEWYCPIDGHRGLGMQGTLVVS